MKDCIFCEIIRGEAPADIVKSWAGSEIGAIAFTPLNPVTPGHVLVVPNRHVSDFQDDPRVTGMTFQYASQLAKELGHESANLITSKGEYATQTVLHLHVHIVPRHENDGLLLPWTLQQQATIGKMKGLFNSILDGTYEPREME